MDFSQNLRVEMSRANATNKWLAEAVGLSLNSIARYRSGLTIPTVPNLYKIQQALGCSMNALFAE